MRIIENIVIYLSLVFRPRVLVRMAREYLRGVEVLKKSNEAMRRRPDQTRNGRQDIAKTGTGC